jgi:thiol-disulfide isomerase/thioredoxin
MAPVREAECMRILVLLVALLLPTASAAPSLSAGQLAPDFALPDQQGNTHRLSSLRGQPVVVNFWASWCGPCLHEMPRLETLRIEADTPVVLINLDKQRGPALGALKRVEHSMLSLFDPEGSVASTWTPPAMPTTYIVAPDGTIAEVLTGSIDDDAVAPLAARLKALKP